MEIRKKAKKHLIGWLEYKIGLLETERQDYENNPNFLQNVKMANSVLIQNEIRGLKAISPSLLKKLRKIIRNSSKKS